MPFVVSCGRPSDGRADACFDELVAAGPGAGLLHVVRTRPRRDALRDRALRARGVLFGDDLATFEDLIRRLAARRREPRRRLADGARALLVAELAERAAPPLRGAPGLAAWLGRLFSTLKAAGAFTREFAEAQFPSLARGGAAAAAALDLLDAYTARLKRDRLYDEDGLVFEVGRDLGTDELPFDRALPRRTRLVLEGFLRTSPAERRAVERLVAAFPSTVYVLDAPDPEDLDDPAAAVYADAVGADLAGEAAWLRGLWGEFVRAAPPRPAAAPRVEAFVARDAEDEARRVAAKLVALRAADPAASILVAVPSDRDALPLYAAACADAGAPLAAGAALPLLDAPRVRAALALLALPDGGFARADVVAALRGAGPALRAETPDGPRPLRAEDVDRAAREAGIFAGRATWAPALAASAARLRAEADAALLRGDDDGADAARRAAARADFVREAVTAFFAAFGDDGAALKIDAFCDRAERLVETCGVHRGVAVLRATFDAAEARAVAGEASASRGLREIFAAYRAAAPALDPAPRAWGAHVVALRRLAAAASVPAPPAPAGAPRLVGLRDVRGLTADYVVVAGLADGAWPEPAAAPPLLDERDAAAASARTPLARRREAEHLLSAAAAAATRGIVWMRPAHVDGAETEPAAGWERVVAGAEVLPAARCAPSAGRAARGADVAAALRRGGADAFADACRELAAAGADVAAALRTVAVERARRDRAQVGRFEGVLEPAALPVLAAAFDARATTWSASMLDGYLACPLQFLFRRVLRVAPPESEDRDVAADVRGDVLHRALRRFYEDAPAGEEEAEAEARLRALVVAEAERLGRDDLYREAFVGRAVSGLAAPHERAGPLKRWFDAELARSGAFRPYAFEYAFGTPGAPRPSVRLVEPGGARSFALRGAVDRIDRDVAADGSARLVVVDYKTGATKPLEAKARRLEALQLWLYARAVEAAERAAGAEARAVGAVYGALSGAEIGLTERLLDPSLAAELGCDMTRRFTRLPEGGAAARIDAAVARACDVADAVAAGTFHPQRVAARDDAACARCGYAAGCRGATEGARLAACGDPRLFALAPFEDAPDAAAGAEDDA
jgi:hypothetical protein